MYSMIMFEEKKNLVQLKWKWLVSGDHKKIHDSQQTFSYSVDVEDSRKHASVMSLSYLTQFGSQRPVY